MTEPLTLRVPFVPTFEAEHLRMRARDGLGELGQLQSLFATEPEDWNKPAPRHVITKEDVTRGLGLDRETDYRVLSLVDRTRTDFNRRSGNQRAMGARGLLISFLRGRKDEIASDIRTEIMRRADAFWHRRGADDMRFVISKSATHKYISRTKGKDGKWEYEYADQKSGKTSARAKTHLVMEKHPSGDVHVTRHATKKAAHEHGRARQREGANVTVASEEHAKQFRMAEQMAGKGGRVRDALEVAREDDEKSDREEAANREKKANDTSTDALINTYVYSLSPKQIDKILEIAGSRVNADAIEDRAQKHSTRAGGARGDYDVKYHEARQSEVDQIRQRKWFQDKAKKLDELSKLAAGSDVAAYHAAAEAYKQAHKDMAPNFSENIVAVARRHAQSGEGAGTQAKLDAAVEAGDLAAFNAAVDEHFDKHGDIPPGSTQKLRQLKATQQRKELAARGGEAPARETPSAAPASPAPETSKKPSRKKGPRVSTDPAQMTKKQRKSYDAVARYYDALRNPHMKGSLSHDLAAGNAKSYEMDWGHPAPGYAEAKAAGEKAHAEMTAAREKKRGGPKLDKETLQKIRATPDGHRVAMQAQREHEERMRKIAPRGVMAGTHDKQAELESKQQMVRDVYDELHGLHYRSQQKSLGRFYVSGTARRSSPEQRMRKSHLAIRVRVMPPRLEW